MRGTKRVAGSDFNPVGNNNSVSKRMLVGSTFEANNPQLDMKRAELSKQHVQALNTQFASWIQSQLQNHPDELWLDGVQDYINHASNIMEKFSDVVNWLKANALNGEKVPAHQKPPSSEVGPTKLPSTTTNTTALFGSSWNFGGQKSLSSENKETLSFTTTTTTTTQSSGGFLGGQKSLLFGNKEMSSFTTTTQSSEGQKRLLSQNKEMPSFTTNTQSFGGQKSLLSENKEMSSFTTTTQSSGGQKSLLSENKETVSFTNTQSSGGLFNNKSSPFSFGIQTSAPANLSSAPANEENNEDEPEQPSSPSVKKSEEKGIITVHEVKCKLYVKSINPEDKDAWKDKGTGQLTIKCKEGFEKATKDSKPTILVRNDVGKVVLNALLYPGIKTNMQKNALVAIFHTSGDGDDSESVIARTFLIRMKTEDDRNKLANIIKEYAPII